MKSIKTAILVAVGLALAGAAQAQGYEYTYTGNPLPNGHDITFSFTTNQPVTSTIGQGQISSWSFSDGVAPVNSSEALPGEMFQFSASPGTIASPVIGAWTIEVEYQIATARYPSILNTTNASYQLQYDWEQNQNGTYSQNNYVPGTWAVAAVPEPATYAMLLAGFVLIGVAARRRSTYNI